MSETQIEAAVEETDCMNEAHMFANTHNSTTGAFFSQMTAHDGDNDWRLTLTEV